MNSVLGASLALLAVAAGSSLAVLRRSRDVRVWLIFGLLVLLGTAEGLALWLAWDAPLGADPASAAAGVALGASGLAVFVVRALGRTLHELDAAEALHWRSMEAVRALAELAGEPGLDRDARLARLLEIGCRCFGLEIGLRSRVSGDRYEVEAIRTPDGFPIRAGAAFPLSETPCRAALASPRPVDVARLEESGWDAHPGRSAFPFAAYLGVALRRGGAPVGTLAFASAAPRATRFTASEKELLLLMARWLETAPEPHPLEATRPAPEPAPEPDPSLAPGWRARPVPPGRQLDLNAVLRRLRPKLADLVGPRVRLRLELDPALAPARDPRLPLDAVVTSLVRHAAAAAQGGGEITLSTADLDLAGGEPGVLPAVAPDRYVTLRVQSDAADLDGDGLARLFDAPAPPREGPLPFARMYRLLQACGGDLSVEAEPGRGASWTVFLPRADAPAAGAPARPPGPLQASA